MSRHYGMNVEIHDFNPHHRDAIEEAANAEWAFEDNSWSIVFYADGFRITNYGEDNLCGGESEEEFADRIAKAIWLANKGLCQVIITATYLEEIPTEEHVRGPKDYSRLMHSDTNSK